MFDALRNAAGYRPYLAFRNNVGEFTDLLIQSLETRSIAVKATIPDKIDRRICVIGGFKRTVAKSVVQIAELLGGYSAIYILQLEISTARI